MAVMESKGVQVLMAALDTMELLVLLVSMGVMVLVGVMVATDVMVKMVVKVKMVMKLKMDAMDVLAKMD